MATPDQFIEIADFSPGIYSDFHAQADASAGGSDTTGAPIIGNGAAQVLNTFNCHADRTGALVPMAKFIRGMESDTIPVSTDPEVLVTDPGYLSPSYPFAYLLDAQIAPRRAIASETSEVVCLYGFYLNPAGTGTEDTATYDFFTLGRSYRVGSPAQPIFDFLWARSPVGTGLEGIASGSLCVTRWNGSEAQQTQHADGYTQLNPASPHSPWTIPTEENTVALWVDNETPCVVALAGTAQPHFSPSNTFSQGTIPANEQQFITKTRDLAVGTLGQDAFVDYPASYTEPETPTYPNGVILGMSVPSFWTEGLENGNWTWHQQDDFFIDYPYNLPRSMYMCVAHQGRVVFADRLLERAWSLARVGVDGGADLMHPMDDAIWYSEWGQPINDWYPVTPAVDSPTGNSTYTELFSKLTPLVIAEDQVAEIGCLGVITGDELLVVKFRDGGVIIRGDLDNPTIRRIPYLESTHGVVSKGAQTPIGFCYGSRNGIYSWQGGDSARKVSNQLDGFFWDHTDSGPERYLGSRGRMCFWNGFLCVPNNYFYDVEQNGWWRCREAGPVFDDTPEGEEDFSNWDWTDPNYPAWNCYEEHHDGQLFAFPYKVDGVDANVVWYQFSTSELTNYYSWQSQPLIETRGRKLSFQDVRLMVTNSAQSSSLIRVTLTGYDEAADVLATRTVDFTVPASTTNLPQLLRRDVETNFLAEYVTIRIQAWTTDETTAAPKIHALRLGVKDRATTIRHGRAS